MADKKPKHKKPYKIITTRAKDGSFGHEHMHEGEAQPVFAGTSRDLEDVHQHMNDHFGDGQEEQPEPEEGGGQPEAEAAE